MSSLTNAQTLYQDYLNNINIYNPDKIFSKIIYYDNVNDFCYRKYNNIYGDTMTYKFPSIQTTISYNYNPYSTLSLPTSSSNDNDILYLQIQDKRFEIYRYLLTSLPGSVTSYIFADNNLISQYYPVNNDDYYILPPIDPIIFSDVLVSLNHRYWSIKYQNPYNVYIPRSSVDKKEMAELSMISYQMLALNPCGVTYNL
jgi:hypothetical protein